MSYFTEEWFNEIIGRAFSYLPAGVGGEILLHGGRFSLTRFANNIIHQNLAREDLSVNIRLIMGKKVGKSSVNQISDDSIRWAVNLALEALRFSPDDPELLDLPEKQQYEPIDSYSKTTAELTPEIRAGLVFKAVEKSVPKKFECAGIVSNGEHFLGIANTNGLIASHKSSSFEFAITVTNNEGGSGWASGGFYDFERVDFDRITERAIRKAELNFNPRELPPGEYTLILEPQAVSDIFSFAAYMGFGAQAYLDGMSFLVGRLGELVFDEKLTIWDDAYSQLNPGLPFDFEGMPRKKVLLVRNGVANSLVHDRKTAKKMNTTSTGHSLPQPNTWGPIPLNIVFNKGNSSLENMIETTEKGLLVTHFHYVNVVEPRKLILTGMTRDGLFLVENGKITSAVKNLRFTESLPKALSKIDLIGSELESCGICVVPALKLNSFNFSSKTEF